MHPQYASTLHRLHTHLLQQHSDLTRQPAKQLTEANASSLPTAKAHHQPNQGPERPPPTAQQPPAARIAASLQTHLFHTSKQQRTSRGPPLCGKRDSARADRSSGAATEVATTGRVDASSTPSQNRGGGGRYTPTLKSLRGTRLPPTPSPRCEVRIELFPATPQHRHRTDRNVLRELDISVPAAVTASTWPSSIAGALVCCEQSRGRR